MFIARRCKAVGLLLIRLGASSNWVSDLDFGLERESRAQLSRAPPALRGTCASCNAAGIITSRISTDCTVTPQGFERSSISFCSSSFDPFAPAQRSLRRGTADDIAQSGLRRPADSLRIVLYLERGFLRIVNHPEQDRVDVRPARYRWSGFLLRQSRW